MAYVKNMKVTQTLDQVFFCRILHPTEYQKLDKDEKSQEIL